MALRENSIDPERIERRSSSTIDKPVIQSTRIVCIYIYIYEIKKTLKNLHADGENRFNDSCDMIQTCSDLLMQSGIYSLDYNRGSELMTARTREVNKRNRYRRQK